MSLLQQEKKTVIEYIEDYNSLCWEQFKRSSLKLKINLLTLYKCYYIIMCILLQS